MTTPRRATIASLVLAAAVLITISMPTAASAHDGIVSSTPEAESTVNEVLESVSMTFSNELMDLGTDASGFAIQVVGPDARFYNLGCVSLDGAIATTDVALGVPGIYQVIWQVVSSDGHRTSDTFSFVYRPDVETETATGADTAPCVTASTPEPVNPDEASEGPSPLWLLAVALIFGILACVAVGIVVLGPRRSHKAASTDDAANTPEVSS